jgi:hypothetical protein
MPTHKFSSSDQPFLAKRQEFFASHEDLKARFVVDNWPIFAGKVGIGKWLAWYEIVKKTVAIPGHVLEFGVNNGGSLHMIAKTLELLSPHNYKRVYGFDSFKGLQRFHQEDRTAVAHRDQYKGNKGLLGETLELHSLGESVVLVDGDIEETLPPFMAQNKHHIYSLINVDVDVYPATQAIMKSVWQQLAVGGLVVFDEGYDEIFPGEGTALQEFLRTVPGQFECHHIAFSREPMLYIQKK